MRVLGLTLLAVMASGLLAGCAGTVAPVPGTTSSTAPTDGGGPDDGRTAAVSSLMAQRASSLARHDERGWLATLAEPTGQFAVDQAAVFRRMGQLPISGFEEHGVAVVASPASGAPAREYGTDAWVASVSSSYELAGYDRGPRTFTASYVVVRAAGGWRLAGLLDTGAAQPWDLTPLRVLRSTTSLVVGNAPSSTLQEYLTLADAAHRRIGDQWGSAVPAVVVVPADAAGFARQLGRTDDVGLDQVAATTDGPLTPGRTATSDRVYVNPVTAGGLTPDGRRVVLTHELTHVAVRATTTSAVPMWLSEGFADYVGYSTVALPPQTVAAELLAQVRAGRGPTRLPPDADFDPARGVIGPVYTGAWLAVRRLVALYGEARVVALYREIASGPTDGAAAADPAVAAARAFPDVLGVSESAFTTDWLGHLRQLAP